MRGSLWCSERSNQAHVLHSLRPCLAANHTRTPSARPASDVTLHQALSSGCVEYASAVIRFSQDIFSDGLEYLT
jgi:hypothetical protein